MGNIKRVEPIPTALTRPYWDAAKEGKLSVQQCSDCNTYQFYPRPFCVNCDSKNIKWKECSGNGSIYTFTINRRAAGEAWIERVPYVVAMVHLDEGVLVMANLVDCSPEEVSIGRRVAVTFETISDAIKLPQFKLMTNG